MQDATRDTAPLVDEPWRSPLDELERTLSEVGRALSALRASLEHDTKTGDVSPPLGANPDEPAEEPETIPDAEGEIAPANFEEVWSRINKQRPKGGSDESAKADISERPGFSKPPPTLPALDHDLSEEAQEVGKSRLSSFEGVWERLERERKERSDGDIEDIAEVRGLGHLPQTYRITVEDRDGTPVDLVLIHRALLTFAPADNISLVNFANGVPIVSIQMEGELDLDRLATTIGAATSRHCEVIPQEKGKLFLRLSVEEGTER